jgi:hypothetical protein
MNSQENGNIAMSENIIIADADYVDSVAFNLIVNFERMLNRALPKADFAQWAVCVALDGGVREGKNDVQVVLVHDKQREEMAHFEPGNFSHTLNAKAFNDAHLGEFTVTSVATDNTISKETYFEEVMETLLHHDEVKRVMLIPDSETGTAYDRLRQLLQHADDDTKRITLFAMEPMPGGNFRQELLGYSLMSALGIKADEINKKI